MSCATHDWSRQKTEIWRSLSWQIGDKHADRICWVIDVYCWLFRIETVRLQRAAPR